MSARLSQLSSLRFAFGRFSFETLATDTDQLTISFFPQGRLAQQVARVVSEVSCSFQRCAFHTLRFAHRFACAADASCTHLLLPSPPQFRYAACLLSPIKALRRSRGVQLQYLSSAPLRIVKIAQSQWNEFFEK